MFRLAIVLLVPLAGCATTDPRMFLREFVHEGSGCPESDIDLDEHRNPTIFTVRACGALVVYRVECGSFRCKAFRISKIVPDREK
jgi:hypothetical protein